MARKSYGRFEITHPEILERVKLESMATRWACALDQNGNRIVDGIQMYTDAGVQRTFIATTKNYSSRAITIRVLEFFGVREEDISIKFGNISTLRVPTELGFSPDINRGVFYRQKAACAVKKMKAEIKRLETVEQEHSKLEKTVSTFLRRHREMTDEWEKAEFDVDFFEEDAGAVEAWDAHRADKTYADGDEEYNDKTYFSRRFETPASETEGDSAESPFLTPARNAEVRATKKTRVS